MAREQYWNPVTAKFETVVSEEEIKIIKKLNSEIDEYIKWELKYEMYLESLIQPPPSVKKRPHKFYKVRFIYCFFYLATTSKLKSIYFIFGDYVFRSLLNFSRGEIEKNAKLHQLRWIEDRSNYDLKYRRT